MNLRASPPFVWFMWLVAASVTPVSTTQKVTLSLDQAIEIIRKGIETPGVSDREAWEASFIVLETAKRNPELVRPWKALFIKEVTRVDEWDHFKSELAGDYHQNLVRALFPLADSNLVALFIRKCKYGSFVKEGLANVGRSAIGPLIEELLHGRYTTCAAMALAAIASNGLGPASQLSAGEKNLLRDAVKDSAVPALERALELAREEEKAPPPPGRGRFFTPRLAESLEEIRQILSGSSPQPNPRPQGWRGRENST
jgi:hypothetical protein